ncbi:SixA phosphatase family protein [Adhaeribacter terreus]|uniref:SixA phosphatase family protein n=1 Tax=Adhaeribacter terreus TaxID=529703 RepID=A0ABW0E9V9_9BACT
MKTLYLMRHAKSSWDFPELNDHDRPLNKRGRQDGPLMGQQLLSRDTSPDLILSSTAVRAITTATLVAKELDYDREKIQAQESIYKAGRNELIKIIQHVPDEINSLLIIGHNPILSEVANKLSPEALPDMPTAGVVALEFNCNSWLDISGDKSKLLFNDFPKNYKQKNKEKDKDKKKDKEEKEQAGE